MTEGEAQTIPYTVNSGDGDEYSQGKTRTAVFWEDRFLSILFSAGSSQCTGERLCWAMNQLKTVPTRPLSQLVYLV